MSLWTRPALCTAARQLAKSWNMCRMAGKSRFAVHHLHKRLLLMLLLQEYSKLCATDWSRAQSRWETSSLQALLSSAIVRSKEVV